MDKLNWIIDQGGQIDAAAAHEVWTSFKLALDEVLITWSPALQEMYGSLQQVLADNPHLALLLRQQQAPHGLVHPASREGRRRRRERVASPPPENRTAADAEAQGVASGKALGGRR